MNNGQITVEMPKEDTQFTSQNQPKNRRSRKGVPNRATKLRHWLNIKRTIPAGKNPSGKDFTGTVEDELELVMIREAQQGNVMAYKEIKDSLYGKIPQNINIDAAAVDAEIERRLALLANRGETPFDGEAESEAIN